MNETTQMLVPLLVIAITMSTMSVIVGAMVLHKLAEMTHAEAVREHARGVDR